MPSKSSKNRFKKPSFEQDFATVYIGNLSYNKSEGSIKKLFAKYGKVINIKIVVDPKTEKSKGIAFVQMTQKQDALKAIKSLNGKIIDGRTFKASIAIESKTIDLEKKNQTLKMKAINTEVKEKPKKKKKKKIKGLNVLFDYLKS